MDIPTVTSFFMWCTIVNMAVYAWAAIWLILAPDFIYRVQGRFFALPRQTFDAVVYGFFAMHKLLIIVFCFVPWMALLIIG